jgi:HSP20 family molecular chaperone IbpA
VTLITVFFLAFCESVFATRASEPEKAEKDSGNRFTPSQRSRMQEKREDRTMTEAAAVAQRAEEKPVTMIPVKVENLKDRLNQASQAIAQRAYKIFQGSERRFAPEFELDEWAKAEVELLHPFHADIVDAGERLEVTAEVPGFNEKEIDISVEPRRVTITGKRQTNKEETKGKTVYSECCWDQIRRIIELPASVDARKGTAILQNGVLQLTMPKTVRAKVIGTKSKKA